LSSAPDRRDEEPLRNDEITIMAKVAILISRTITSARR
jgi:hypothetical protein